MNTHKKNSPTLSQFIDKNRGKKVQVFYYVHGLRSACPQSEVLSLANLRDCKKLEVLNKSTSINVKVVDNKTNKGYTTNFNSSDFCFI